MSQFYTIGFIFFTFINFVSILLLYNHYQNFKWLAKNQNFEAKNIPKSKDKSVIVNIGNGSLVGFKQKFNRIYVNTFLSIPYAQKPQKQLRFKKPKEFKYENKQILTNKWPNPCLQPDNHLRLNNNNFSEDCLYLNVWSPDMAENDEKQLPVLVIIHTGAFIFGSASEYTYNGLALSQMSNSVVVTFNYRLNLFGFYYDNGNTELIAPNVGILDQVMVLQWVKQNIHHFNGDPDRILLIGQSSAGLATGMHITSPLSRNLFSQAIIMSGSPLQAESLNTPENVHKFWSNYEKYQNCTEKRSKVDCLIEKVSKNRNSLISMEMVKTLSEDKLFVNIPIVVDDNFQPKKQTNLLNSMNNYEDNKPLSLLFGYTDDEGSWIASLEDKKTFNPKSKPNLTVSEAKETMKDFINKMKPIKNITNAMKFEEHYLENLLNKQPEAQDPQIIARLVTELLADHYIKCPSNIFSEKLLKKNANIFQYHWNYKGNPKTSPFWSAFSNVWCGEWMGSCHSFEMFALFGQPFLEPENFNDEDRIVSTKFIRMISYFAHKNNLFWPKFDDSSKVFYIIDSSLNEHKFGKNLKVNECNSIWYDYII